jgi:hypothetical protein
MMSEELAPRPVTRIGRERAAELLARNEAKVRVDGYVNLMLGALDDGYIQAGEGADGSLHWRITPKGIAVKGQLERQIADLADPS